MSEPDLARAVWRFLPDEVCLVSPIGSPDGIARYSDQLLRELRSEHRVTVAPVRWWGRPGYELVAGWRALKLLAVTRATGSALLMWHPVYYVAGRRHQRLLCYAALTVLAGARELHVMIHEPDGTDTHPEPGRLRTTAATFEEWLRRRFWSRVASVVVHSEWEVARFRAQFGNAVTAVPVHVTDHGGQFVPTIVASQADARAALDVPTDAAVLLCLGHLSRVKGFERAVEAFGAAMTEGALLYVVGGPVMENADVRDFIAELADLAAATPGVDMRVGTVDDETFDLWLQAADVVLAPYRVASSSSTVPRAQMFGRPVIGSDAGALPEQVDASGTIVHDDGELRAAIEAHVRRVRDARGV